MTSPKNALAYGMLLFLISIVACKAKTVPAIEDDLPKEMAFNQKFPTEDMNNAIHLSLPSEWNPEFRIGKSLSIKIENTTSFPFVFPYWEGPTILSFLDNEWIELKNLTDYGQIDMLIPASSFGQIEIFPIPKSFDQPVELRIVLTGILDHDGSRKQVGAFVDVILDP